MQLKSLFQLICYRLDHAAERLQGPIIILHKSLVVRKPAFLHNYAKTKTQICFAITAKLISAFVFATWIVQSLFYLNPKFQASRHLLSLYSPVCVGPGRKPRRPVFSERGSHKDADTDDL